MLHHEYTNKNLTKVIFFHKKFKIIHDKTKKQNVYLFLYPTNLQWESMENSGHKNKSIVSCHL